MRYRGYDEDDIVALGDLREPMLTQRHRVLRFRIVDDLCDDMMCYRKFFRALNAFRRAEPEAKRSPASEDPHLDVSLKHNHLYNGFARLASVEEFLSKQGDLFDC